MSEKDIMQRLHRGSFLVDHRLFMARHDADSSAVGVELSKRLGSIQVAAELLVTCEKDRKNRMEGLNGLLCSVERIEAMTRQDAVHGELHVS